MSVCNKHIHMHTEIKIYSTGSGGGEEAKISNGESFFFLKHSGTFALYDTSNVSERGIKGLLLHLAVEIMKHDLEGSSWSGFPPPPSPNLTELFFPGPLCQLH